MTTSPISRRDWLAASAAAAALVLTGRASAVPTRAPAKAITIYKSPTCGCCARWVDHVRAAGFAATVHDTPDMDPIKARYGVPKALQSCHTALVDGYVVEGHVPAADVLRLLRERPKVKGLAVPQMPAGSPGMEMGGAADPYDVVAFSADGKTTRVFAHH
jgi:hypothetical protein